MKKLVYHYDEQIDGKWVTKCGIGPEHRTVLSVVGRWEGVTCKNCLKHKPKRKPK